MQPPVGNALGVVSSQGQGQGGGPGGGGERPNSTSMAGAVMDGPTLNMGRVRPRERVGNEHVLYINTQLLLFRSGVEFSEELWPYLCCISSLDVLMLLVDTANVRNWDYPLLVILF